MHFARPVILKDTIYILICICKTIYDNPAENRFSHSKIFYIMGFNIQISNEIIIELSIKIIGHL